MVAKLSIVAFVELIYTPNCNNVVIEKKMENRKR